MLNSPPTEPDDDDEPTEAELEQMIREQMAVLPDWWESEWVNLDLD